MDSLTTFSVTLATVLMVVQAGPAAAQSGVSEAAKREFNPQPEPLPAARGGRIAVSPAMPKASAGGAATAPRVKTR